MDGLTRMPSSLQFFFVFVVWTTFFCLWTLGTLVGLTVRAATRHETTVDPQKIATIALYVPFCFPLPPPHFTENRRSGLFSMFAVVMLSTHFVLISTNQTTLEHFNARTTKDRENAVLDEMHSTWDFRCVSPSFFLPSTMSYFMLMYLLVSGLWLILGRNAAHDESGMPSMVVLGARVICGGLAACARIGSRSLVQRRGHGFVRLSLFFQISQVD
jgi:hypothetical protein